MLRGHLQRTGASVVPGLLSAAMLLALVGCGGGDGEGTTGPAPSGGASGDLGDGNFDPYTDSDGDGKPDTGPGCKAVDLLFVVDNSPSMGPYQQGLATAFPGFVDAMYERLPAHLELHVGMTTTSFWAGACGEGHQNCQTLATPEEVKAHYMTPMEGSTGVNGEQGRLYEWDGKRFFTANTSDKQESGLKDWFSAAATSAGENGCSFEMSAAGAGYALHPANAATNQGFLRDASTLLLIFVLSDEPDKSPEGVEAYAEMARAAKGDCGEDTCIITGGLVTPCVMAGQNQLYDFLSSFGEKPVLGSIEEPEKYTEVVGDTLAKAVEDACAEVGAPK
jgi:hypothetical protein